MDYLSLFRMPTPIKITGRSSSIANAFINSIIPIVHPTESKEWRLWMVSDAKLSPKSKGVTDLNERISRLEVYESWGIPTQVDFEAIVGNEIWDQHWKNWELVQSTMQESQKLAEQINAKVANTQKML